MGCIPEYDFVRFAEEQFTDGWFDVLLARSVEIKVDQIEDLNQFGALILDRYEYVDESTAFEKLRSFAQGHLLILLSSNAPLFRRIEASIDSFHFAKIIERPRQAPGKYLEALTPTTRYGSSAIRRTWAEIRRVLDSQKVSIDDSAITVKADVSQTSIDIDLTSAPSIEDLP